MAKPRDVGSNPSGQHIPSKNMNIQTATGAAYALISEHEGTFLKCYLCPAGVPTIGTGHTGPDVKIGMTITLAQAEAFLHEDVKEAEASIRSLVKVPLNQNQFDALVSFVFNLGETALKSSTLLRYLNARNYKAAAQEFGKWVYAKDKSGKLVTLPGLVKRRKQEADLFASPVGIS